MRTLALKNFGEVVKYGTVAEDGTITATTIVAATFNVEYPKASTSPGDITNNSNTDGAKEFLDTGLIDWGEFSFDLVWNPADATHKLLRTTGGLRGWNVLYSNGTMGETFAAIQTPGEFTDSDIEGRKILHVVAKVTGAVTFDHT